VTFTRFRPRRVVVEEAAADTDLARRFPDAERVERFVPEPLTSAKAARSTLVITRWRAPRLERFTYCEDFSFHLAAGCPLHCSYCTLLYRLPRHPYLQAYANVDEILGAVTRHVEVSPDPTTVLVVGDNTDVLALEPLLGTLRIAIEHFGRALRHRARLEFLTKAPEVASILDADHRGATSVGYSLNTPRAIAAVEHGTASLDERLHSLKQARDAGYPLFLNFAPIFPYEGWEGDYGALLERCRDELGDERLRMEVEVHWQKADEVALSERLYPRSDHALLRHDRVPVAFPDGSVLHRVPDATYERIRAFFEDRMGRLFPRAESRLVCPPADPRDLPEMVTLSARPSPE